MRAFAPLLLRTLPIELRQYLDLGPLHSVLKTPCILYTYPRESRNGYKRRWCKIAKKERQVHILVFESVCHPVPDGHFLDHLCKNRQCCAPWHLEPVTPRVNTLRGDAILFQRKCEYVNV